MSSPGLQPDPADVQQQQPLLVPPPGTNPELMKLQQALAQQMQQQPSGPVYSRWEALSRAVSPLAGALLQKHLANQQFQQQQAAMPEIAAALQSDDPLKAMMGSKSPLVQQMALQYMPDWMKAQIGVRSHVSEANQMIAPHVAEASAMIPGKVAEATAMIPVEAKKAAAVSDATLATKLKEIAAGQSATLAGQAETRRHNLVTEGLSGDRLDVSKAKGAGYKPPWEQ